MTRTRRLAVPLIVVGMLLSLFSLWRPAAADAPDGSFQGVCTSAVFPMTCTLDEPEGVNPATHGTITVARAGDVFTFTWTAPEGATLSPVDDAIKLCVVPKTDATNPFVPTNANTCVGPEPLRFAAFPVVFDAGPVLAEAEATELWFTLHVDILDGGARTTYVVGPGVAGATGTTTTSTSPTTTTSSTTTSSSTSTSTTVTTSPSTTTTPARTDDSTPPAAQVAAADETATKVLGVTIEADALPRTGSPIAGLLVVGLALVGCGVALLLVGRRTTTVA